MDLSDPSDFEAQLDMIDPPMTPNETKKSIELKDQEINQMEQAFE
jgi:hypothetical protein